MKKLVVTLMLLAPLAVFAQKFGHLNASDVMQAMPETAKFQSDMEALRKQYENDEKTMIAEYQKKIEEYQAQEASLPDNVKQRRVQEIQEMETKIQQARQDNYQALQKAAQERQEPIQKKLLDAIKAVGQEGGYVYIMDVNAGVPYISTTLSTDVTAQVKAKLGLK